MDVVANKASIAGRLMAWFTVSAFFMLVLNSAVAYWGFTATMEREDDEHLRSRVELLYSLLRGPSADRAALKAEIEGSAATGRFTEYLVRILDARGAVVVETPGMADELTPTSFPTPAGSSVDAAAGTEILSPSGQEYRALTVRTEPADGAEPVYLVQVAMNRTYEKVVMARLRLYLGAFLLAALAGCALLGWRIVRQGLRPIAQMIRTVERIRSSSLGERIRVQDLPVELSRLAQTFNTMMDHLEESFRRLSQFSSNLAHELRTPVNNLRGELEVALGQPRSAEEYRETLGSVLEECLRLTRLVDALLFLARADAAQTAAVRQPVNVAGELERIRDFFEAAAAEVGTTISIDADPAVAAMVDPVLFHRAIANLVSNALDHTTTGDTIRLTARATPGAVEIMVTDSGCGIAAEALPHVFDRFYRADPARAGQPGRLGLGLAIVSSIARLHGGAASITSKPGNGTQVTLQFPQRPSTPIDRPLVPERTVAVAPGPQSARP